MSPKTPPETEQHNPELSAEKPVSSQEQLLREASKELHEEFQNRTNEGLAELETPSIDISSFRSNDFSLGESQTGTYSPQGELLMRHYGLELPEDDDVNSPIRFTNQSRGSVSLSSAEIDIDDASESAKLFQQRVKQLKQGKKVEGMSLDNADDVTDLVAVISATSKQKVPPFIRAGEKVPQHLRAAELSEALYHLPVFVADRETGEGQIFSDDRVKPVQQRLIDAKGEGASPDMLAAISGGVFFDEDGALSKIVLPPKTKNEGANLVITPENTDADLLGEDQHINIEVVYQDDVIGIPRDGEGGLHPEVPRFLASETGKMLLDTFDEAGLKLSERIERSFKEVNKQAEHQKGFELGFGHGYADFSREIAKLVTNENRPLSMLFEEDDIGGEYASIEDKILAAINLDKIDTESPAGMQLAILRQVAERSNNGAPSNDIYSELPVGKQSVDMRDGSCKDFETNLSDQYKNSSLDAFNGKALVSRDHTPPTFLSQEPIQFNGIVLPAGSIFLTKINKPEEYYFSRVSMFAFDSEDLPDSFGAQHAKTIAGIGAENDFDYLQYRLSSARDKLQAEKNVDSAIAQEGLS